MTREEQENNLEGFTAKMKSIIAGKGDDYAGDVDRLRNFKLVAEIVGITPEQVITVFIATKAVRLGQLLSSGQPPKNESIEDTLIDNANYSALLKMVMDENAGKQVANPTGKWEVGRIIQVTKLVHRHNFMIGEFVTIVRYGGMDGYWICSNGIKESLLSENEGETID